MTFIGIILAIVVIVLAFKFNVMLGIVATLVIIGYGLYLMMPSSYVINGKKAFAAGNEEEALTWYKRAYDTGRTKVVMKTEYAYLLMRAGHLEAAEKVLDPIIRVKKLELSKRNLAKQQRCMVYYKQGRLDEAIEEAMELYESGYKTTHLYGMLCYFKLLRSDSLEETLKLCEEAYDYNSDDRDIKDNMSLCYYRAGRYEEAEKISDELIEAQPDFLEAYYHGTQIAMKRGNYKKAKEYAQKLPECKRSGMTTISEEDVEKLIREVNNHNENTAG